MFLFFRNIKKNIWDLSAEEVDASHPAPEQTGEGAENFMSFGFAGTTFETDVPTVPSGTTAFAPEQQNTLHL